MIQKLMKIDEVADLLSISPTTLRNKDFRLREGLHIIRVGRSIRFTHNEIEAYIKRHMEGTSDNAAESDDRQ